MNTATESGSTRAGTTSASAIMPDGTHAFVPDNDQPSPSRSATSDGASGLPPSSTSAVVITVSPPTIPGSHLVRCASVPNVAMARRRGRKGLNGRHVRGGAAGGLYHEAGLDEAETRAPDLFGKRDAEETGRGELRPELAIEVVSVGLRLDLA